VSAGARFALSLTLLSLFVYGMFGVVGVALWLDAEPAQRAALRSFVGESIPLLVILALLLPLPLAGLLRWWIRSYPAAAVRMFEELALIRTVNPEHRITVSGAKPMRQLGDAINILADSHRRFESQVQQRVEGANQRLQEERNRLAALMSELASCTLSVIVMR